MYLYISLVKKYKIKILRGALIYHMTTLLRLITIDFKLRQQLENHQISLLTFIYLGGHIEMA